MASLKEKTVSGVKWLVISKVLEKVISVGAFAVLARILSPSTFGIFAMAFVAINGLQLFKSLGIDSALIQRRGDLDKAYHTASILFFLSGVGLFLIAYAAAPFAGLFFKNQHLESVVRALGIIFLVSSFSRVPASVLRKKMQFRTTAIIDLTCQLVNSVLAVFFALLWKNVWSLVFAYLIDQALSAVLNLYFSKYRFHWQFDMKVAKELLNFGRFMIGVAFLLYIAQNINQIFVGKMLGAALLGYFALANNAGNLINSHFTQLVSKVLFPAYSTIQHDREAMKRAYLKTVQFVTMFSIPFCMALVSLSDVFVLTLYGEKWIRIIPLIQLFGVVQLMVPIMACAGSVYMAAGKPNYTFWTNFYMVVAKLILIYPFAKKWGLEGVVISEMVTNACFLPVNIMLVKSIAGFSMKEFFGRLAPSAFCSLVMLGVVFTLKKISVVPILASLVSHHFAALILFGLSGVFAYIVAFFLVDRPASLEAKRMIFRLERA